MFLIVKCCMLRVSQVVVTWCAMNSLSRMHSYLRRPYYCTTFCVKPTDLLFQHYSILGWILGEKLLGIVAADVQKPERLLVASP